MAIEKNMFFFAQTQYLFRGDDQSSRQGRAAQNFCEKIFWFQYYEHTDVKSVPKGKTKAYDDLVRRRELILSAFISQMFIGPSLPGIKWILLWLAERLQAVSQRLFDIPFTRPEDRFS
jgi:hypothetical protein